MKKIFILIFVFSSFLFSHGLEEWWMIPFVVTSSPTSYTSNTFKKKNTKGYTSETYEFIKNNRVVLETEIAQGDGETLDTLASLYEDMKDIHIESLTKWKDLLQRNYDKIFYADKKRSTDEQVDYILFDLTYNLKKRPY